MINKKILYIIPILVFTFIFGVNNVKAEYDYTTDTPLITSCFGSNCAYLYHNKIDNELLFHRTKDGSRNNKTISLDEYPYFYCYDGVNLSCTLSTEPLFATKDSSGNYNGGYIPADVKMYILDFRASYNEDFYNSSTLNGPTTFSNSPLYKNSNYKANYNINFKDSTDIHINKNYDTTPTIKISETTKTYVTDIFGKDMITSIIYNINFSIFNLDKYKYYYSYDLENWVDINSNDYELTMTKNGSFYIKIEDLKGNFITSTTYITTSISGVPPTLTTGINKEKDNMIYENLISIPISYLYDHETKKFNPYNLYFLSKSTIDSTSNYYIELNESDSDKPHIPIMLSFLENVDNITNQNNVIGIENNVSSIFESIINSKCQASLFPYKKTIYNDNTNIYNRLNIMVGGCEFEKEYNLEDYKTTIINIYYNGRVYESVNNIVNDYKNNPESYEPSEKHFVEYLENTLEYFREPINEIFKLLRYFFNNLPVQLRYMFIAIFIIGITLIIFKIIL